MTRRRLAAGAVAAAIVLAAGLAWALTRPPAPEPVPPPPRDPALARWAPLEPGSLVSFEVAWDRLEYPVGVERLVVGWELLDGAPHARVVTQQAPRRRKGLVLTEWLRPDEGRLLCSQRQVARDVLPLAPPQPLLVLPLEPGQTWTWAGTVGERAATATFRVLEPGPGDGEDVRRVEQRTTVGETTVVRVQTWRSGAGLVAETGAFPDGEMARGRAGIAAVRSAAAP